MDRISGAGHVNNRFVAEDVPTNRPPTEITEAWLNTIQEELAALPEGVGMTLDPNNPTQVREAIQRMIDAQSGNYALDTGAANAYVVALSPAITAYGDGMTVRMKIANANNGASTLDAGGGALPMVNQVGDALVNGDLHAGSVITAIHIAAAGKFYLTSMVSSQTLPTGTIFDYAGTEAPLGSILCPTSPTNISRTVYAALFAAIGTTWGPGDGNTTFGIPYFPANYTAVQSNANVGTSTTGVVLAHAHQILADLNDTSGGTSVALMRGNGVGTQQSIASYDTGGTANLAAGMRVLKCVKY